MSISALNGPNPNHNVHNNDNRVDQKELEVAKKLVSAGIISSVQEFQNLTEAEKAEKVQEYNKTHPNDQIGDKGAAGQIQPPEQNQGTQSGYGSEMSKFMKDVDWDKIKLQ